MANLPKRLYWDACAWIAAIQNEILRDASGSVVEHRGGMCRAVIEAAKGKSYELLTSALSLVEVSKKSENELDGEADKIRGFLENPYVLVVPLDTYVGTVARGLMVKGYAGLKPPDAIHLATAIVGSVEEFHTFDVALLKLNGLISALDGTPLRVCKPTLPASPVPLLESLDGNMDISAMLDEAD